MENTFQKIPFLRIAVAFAIGIFIGESLPANTFIHILGAVVILVVLLFLNHKYSYKTEHVVGFFIPLLFLFLGSAVYSNYNRSLKLLDTGIFVGTLLEKPQEKQNSYKSLLRITAVKSADTTFQTNETVLVYFEKSESIDTLQAGQQILFNSAPKIISNFGTPYGFDYKSYLKNKRIYRQVYLNSESWKATNFQTKSLSVSAELLRENLLNIFRQQNLGANETEILSALTLGYKRDLDPETKRVFSAAGAMHVLAVSGLHVGILFLVFSYMFGFLQKQIIGRNIFIALAILLLWTYTFITGLSPSVLRASTMFTIVIIGTNIQRKASVYNSLAASALLLLLINPNNLFEVGFQLSYSAVFGIVFLQPKLVKLWTIKYKLPNFFWKLFCVSLAAQIATFPLSAFYFNQFPVYFWLSNLIVIPAATILIPLAMLLLIVSKVPLISVAVASLVKGLIQLVYFVLQSIQAFPFSTLDVSLYTIELLFLIVCLFFIFVFIQTKRARPLIIGLTFLLLLSASFILNNYRQYKSCELIIFNNPANITVQLIRGQKNYVITEDTIPNDDFIYRQIQEVKRKKRLSKTIFIDLNSDFQNEELFLTKGVLSFGEKTISLAGKELNLNISPDYLIIQKGFDFETHKSKFNKTTIIYTTYANSKTNDSNIHSLKSNGVFSEKW